MGRDKALLPLADGRLLWQRQLEMLRTLGPAELFISGPGREGFPVDVPLLADGQPGLGPLAGIAAALRAMRSPQVVVLAVDMPAMTADCLEKLLRECGEGRGVIPLHPATGFYEPLAAVYPRSALAAAEEQLRGTDLSLQTFVCGLVRCGLVTAHPVTGEETSLFTNWNQPGDRHHDA